MKSGAGGRYDVSCSVIVSVVDVDDDVPSVDMNRADILDICDNEVEYLLLATSHDIYVLQLLIGFKDDSL